MGLGLWCLTPHSTIFQLAVYCGAQFYCRRIQTCRKSITIFITQYCIEYTVIQNLSSLKEYEIYLIMIKKKIDFLIYSRWCLFSFCGFWLPVWHTDLSQVNNNLYHAILYRIHLSMSKIRTHNVSGDALIAQVVVNIKHVYSCL
jgi:hypothetical protein